MYYPMVSICIPVFNGENFINDCIHSALSQDYPSFELLISDNNSIDNTVKIIETNNDKRIRLLKNEVNIGMLGNFKKLVDNANGDYVIFLSHDDLFENKLAISTLMQPFFLTPNISLVSGKVRFIGTKEGESNFKNLNGLVLGKDFVVKSLEEAQNLIYLCSTIFKKELYNSIGFIDNIFFDWNFWLNCGLKGDIFIINEIVAEYRWHNRNETKTVSKDLYIHYSQLRQSLILFNSTEEFEKEKLIAVSKLHYNYLKNSIPNNLNDLSNFKLFLYDDNVKFIERLRNISKAIIFFILDKFK